LVDVIVRVEMARPACPLRSGWHRACPVGALSSIRYASRSPSWLGTGVAVSSAVPSACTAAGPARPRRRRRRWRSHRPCQVRAQPPYSHHSACFSRTAQEALCEADN